MIITEHMNTDPNSVKHAMLGGLGSLITAIAGYALSTPWLSLVGVSLLAAFIMGVVIEIVQRAWRSFEFNPFKYVGWIGAHQNTFKENILDVFQTGLFYITFWVTRNRK